MKPEELVRAPKLFCENIKIGYTPEYFVLALTSGTEPEVYALTPQHAKRLQEYLAHEIMGFEKAHGAITATWNPNIVSPFPEIGSPKQK